MLRFLILALCVLAVLVPLPLIAIAVSASCVALVAALHLDESRHDVQRVALLALTPFRAPPAAALC